MEILPDPQIVAAIVTVALTVFAGVLGYVIRELKTRARPFIAVVSVEGDVWHGEKIVPVPDPIYTAIKNLPVLTTLAERDQLNTIRRVYDETKHIVENAHELLDLISQLRKAINNNEPGTVQSILSKILGHPIFDLWLTPLIGEGHIAIPSSDSNQPVIISTSEEQEIYNGTIWIGFPGDSVLFGQQLNRFAIFKQNLKGVVSLIERLELTKITEVFNQVEKHISELLKVSKDVNPLLQKIMDQNSQWVVRLYVANLGKTPFLINKSATLHVLDSTGAKYAELCDLILLSKNESGNIVRRHVTSPMVLRSESDVTFEFVTSMVQAEMQRGEAFREVFTSKTANCWITFSVEKVGFKREGTFTTPKVKFAESS